MPPTKSDRSADLSGSNNIEMGKNSKAGVAASLPKNSNTDIVGLEEIKVEIPVDRRARGSQKVLG